MDRVWLVSPSSDEIVQDIRRFPNAVDRVIECEGAKVPELDNRRGRRRSSKKADAKMVTLHDDCDEALAERESKFTHLESKFPSLDSESDPEDNGE